MKAPRSRISRLVADRTLKSGTSKKFGQEIAAYLLSERRVNELGSIMRDVQVDWAEAGFVEVVATSAYPLGATTKADIVKQVKKLYPHAKRVSVSEVRDTAIIGGIRLGLANRQLDLSVEAKLNKFKQLTLSGKD